MEKKKKKKKKFIEDAIKRPGAFCENAYAGRYR